MSFFDEVKKLKIAFIGTKVFLVIIFMETYFECWQKHVLSKSRQVQFLFSIYYKLTKTVGGNISDFHTPWKLENMFSASNTILKKTLHTIPVRTQQCFNVRTTSTSLGQLIMNVKKTLFERRVLGWNIKNDSFSSLYCWYVSEYFLARLFIQKNKSNVLKFTEL